MMFFRNLQGKGKGKGEPTSGTQCRPLDQVSSLYSRTIDPQTTGVQCQLWVAHRLAACFTWLHQCTDDCRTQPV
jgi:hypothetical protein